MNGPRRPGTPVWLEDERFAGALLVLCVLLAYALAFAGARFHFDDFHNLVENEWVRSLRNVPRFFVDVSTWSAIPDNVMYRPLQTTSYAIDFAIWDYRAAGWVLTNCLLHAAVAVLTWRLALRIGLSPLAAFLAGAVMGLHPVNSEVVNYVSSRSESLAALLLLVALHAHLTARSAAGSRRVVFAAAALFVSMLSLTAKETTALFFVAVAWMEVVLTPGGPAPRLRRAAAFGALYGGGLLVMMAVRGHMLEHATAPVPILTTPDGVDVQAGGRLSIVDNLLKVQSRVVVLYYRILLRPAALNVDYDVARTAAWSGAAVVALAIHAAIAGWAVAAARRGSRLLPLCVGWFWLFLAPSIAFPLNVIMNEHRLYLPMIAVALLAGAALARVATLLAARWGELRGTLAAGAPLVLFVVLCGERSLDWRSDVVLWETAVRRAPSSARAHMHLGAAWHERFTRGEDPSLAVIDRALAEYHLAERLFPGSYDTQLNIGSAYVARGRVSGSRDDFDSAVEAYRKAGRIVGASAPRPKYLESQALTEAGRYDEALAIMSALRAADTSRTTIYDDAEARIHRRRGDLPAAAAAMQRVIAIQEPEGRVDGLLTLGWWHFEDGDLPSARDLVDRAMTVSKRELRAGRKASFEPYLYAARMLRLLGVPGADGYLKDARALGWSAEPDELRWVEGGPTPGARRGTVDLPTYGSPR
jgi:tetratricopeptide (TPR) repeat protein